MEKLFAFISKQKVLANLIAVFLMTVGLAVFTLSPKESLPEIKLGLMVINTVFPGAGPEEIEKLITTPLEDAVKNIKGFSAIDSTSAESVSTIVLSVKTEVKDTQALLNDVKNAVSKVQGLPEDANEPEILEITTDEFPVLQVSVSGPSDYSQLREASRLIENRILKIDGVAKVNKAGYLDKVIWIEADASKLRSQGLTIFGIVNAVKAKNASVPAGNRKFGGREFGIKSVSEITGADDAARVIVRANEAGKGISIRDIAYVKDGFSEETSIVKADGKKAVIMTVLKARGGDTITINKSVRKAADEMKKILPGEVNISFANDSSKFIADRLSVVNSNGIFGGILVLALIVLLIRPSIAFLTAASIPVVFGASLITIKMLGYTYDMLSLFGYVMAIGLLVDNAIVVGENVYRYMEEKNLAVDDAVSRGTAEVVLPVIASTATTVASFFPLIMVSGVLGSFLRPIPVVIIITLIISAFQVFLILPAQLTALARSKKSRLIEKQEQITLKLRGAYEKSLRVVIKRKKTTLAAVLVLFMASVWLGTMNGFSFFTSQVDEVIINVKMPVTNSLQDSLATMEKIEQKAMALDPQDLETVYTYVGTQQTGGVPETAANKGQVNVVLQLSDKRKTSNINEIINKLRNDIGKPEGVTEISVSGVRREGGPVRRDIEINVTADSYERILEINSKILPLIGSIKGAVNVTADYEEGKPEYRINIREDRAALAGVNIAQAGALIRGYVSGIRATSFRKNGDDIDIIVRAKDASMETIDGILSLTVPNFMGKAVPLRTIAYVSEGKTVKSLKHKDTKKTVTISGDVDKKQSNNAAVNAGILKALEPLKKEFPDADIAAGGEFKEMMKSFSELGTALLVAMFLIYIILAAMFNSLLQPFIIMLAIPFGLIGVMLTLFVHGMPLSFGAFMGFVALAGVVVNNSLILNDFVNRMKKEETSSEEAVIEACKIRLRPILLTTATSIVGLLPLGYGLFGNKDPFLQPVALVFAWGLLVSAVITLFIIPIFISYSFKLNGFIKEKTAAIISVFRPKGKVQ